MALLELQQLDHAYGNHKVVDGLSLELAPGKIGCLLGPSGCGKTTVLRCIAGFERPDRGVIRVGGEQVSGPGLHVATEQRRIGMVFQNYALFPHLSVAANIAFGLQALAPARRTSRVEQLLVLVGLSSQAGKYPHELSGGQQQRVALARALAPRPRLLLLDEPFSSLDVDLRERLAAEVGAILRAEGTTAVLVTHDQHEAFAMADEVGVMQHGRIQQWDTPYNLYHRPLNRFVADFVGQGAFVPGEVLAGGTIRIGLGELPRPAAGAAQWQGGDRVSVLLRPDDIVHDDDSQVKAEVLAKAFRGAEFLYTLRLGSGEEVLSLVPSHHDHAPGERIGIRLDVNHVVAFAQ